MEKMTDLEEKLFLEMKQLINEKKGIGKNPNPFLSGVGKGTRTLDTRNHNPVLCQLNYTHHK